LYPRACRDVTVPHGAPTQDLGWDSRPEKGWSVGPEHGY
jgi:hypothetical protein